MGDSSENFWFLSFDNSIEEVNLELGKERVEIMEIQQQSYPLTLNWRVWSTNLLYLDRCRVDTPSKLVKLAWEFVHRNRLEISKVVDFGAGDGRFATYGRFQFYIGFEIDTDRCVDANIPANAELHNCCAFS